MTISDNDRGPQAVDRLGGSFALLMQVRMLVATATLLLLPSEQITVSAVTLVSCLSLLSWIAARYWRLLLPRLLNHPTFLGIDVMLSFAVLSLGGTQGPFLLYTFASATVAGLLYRWPGTVVMCLLQVACYSVVLGTSRDADSSFQVMLGQPGFYVLAGFAGVGLRRLIDQREAMAAARNQAERAAATAEERARLARDLHDSLAKTLRGIALQAEALPAWMLRDPERAVTEARRIHRAAEIGTHEARGLIAGLRDDVTTLPLPDAVRNVAASWSTDSGIGMRCEASREADLPVHHRREVVAILAEALENVVRHAGAREVGVRLTRESGDVVLSVRDDGCGFTVEPRDTGRAMLNGSGRYGLRGLRERAQRMGGTLVVASLPGEGTAVTARIPLGPPKSSGRAARAGGSPCPVEAR